MTFAYPFVLYLAPLILLAAFLLRSKKELQTAPLYPSTALLEDIPKSSRLLFRRLVLFLLGISALSYLTIAAARPQVVTTLAIPSEGRNILLVLDLSGSMRTPDFRSRRGTLTRMNAVKAVVQDYVQERIGDRIGLVIFGDRAFLQSPLTLDNAFLLDVVDSLHVGVAGDGTAIGDGLGLALKRLEHFPSDSASVILLTDGVNNSGQVDPLQAARVAGDLGIKVYTIGIGVPAREQRSTGRIRNVSRGEFDEKTLLEIADVSNGRYFNAADLESLRNVYDEIDKLESSKEEEPTRQLIEELGVTYTARGLFLLTLYLFFANTLFFRYP